jgi:hypothetical protein
MLRNTPEEPRSHEHCGGSLKSLFERLRNTVILIWLCKDEHANLGWTNNGGLEVLIPPYGTVILAVLVAKVAADC